MAKNSSFVVQGSEIRLFTQKEEDYISLTDIAKRVNPRSEIVIQNRIRSRDTVEFLGVWEQLPNPEFKHIEFDVFKLWVLDLSRVDFLKLLLKNFIDDLYRCK